LQCRNFYSHRRFNFRQDKSVFKRDYHFWLRAETKPREARTILLPEHVIQLLQKGHQVTLEESTQRCIPDTEYKKIGAKIQPAGSWIQAPKEAIIMGLKELPDKPDSLIHNHIFFGHCYKGQKSAKALLERFKNGNGTLWDLEFLLDEKNRRVAAFGVSAGRIGMALGLIMWSDMILGRPHKPLQTFPNYPKLREYVKNSFKGINESPKVLIIGAKGRVGGGSLEFAESCGIKPTSWDIEQTQGKEGPFKEILDYSIFVNTINLAPSSTNRLVFINAPLLKENPKYNLKVIVDISCDHYNPANPLPLYNSTTNFEKPTHVVSTAPPLELIAIDHLPALVPEESSREFASALLPHLYEYGSSLVWKKSLSFFIRYFDQLL